MKTRTFPLALVVIIALVAALWQPPATASAATVSAIAQLDVVPRAGGSAAGVFAVIQRQQGGKWQDASPRPFWLAQGSGSVSWPLLQRGVYRWVLRDSASLHIVSATAAFVSTAPGSQLRRVLLAPAPGVAAAAPKQSLGNPGILPGAGGPLPGLQAPTDAAGVRLPTCLTCLPTPPNSAR